jgi:hypothetical protein
VGRIISVKLISAEERLAEVRGVSLLIDGPTGVGNTSLLKTLGPEALAETLFVDIEAGDLPVAALPVASVRPRTAQECMDLACAIGGADPALPPSSAYSQAHFNAVSADPELMRLAHYKFIFIDSLTAVGRLFFRHSEQMPEAFTDRGKKDLRTVYGIYARNAIGWLNQWQHARGLTVIFVAILERATDDSNTPVWGIQLEGSKAARELPGIVDQVITMTWVNFGDGKPPLRCFVCTGDNPWGYPAKDRSGKLDQIEPPDLGKLLAKIKSSTGST